MALARAFSRRGLHAEALRELEGIQGLEGVPADALAYRLSEAYRAVGDTTNALRQSWLVVTNFPASRYFPYAQLAVALSETGAARQKRLASLEAPAVPPAVREVASYHLSAARATSADPAERRRALAAYLDLAHSKNAGVAEEALYYAAMLSYREKRYAESTPLFKRLRTLYPRGARTVQARPLAAWSAYLSGHPAEALALAEDLLATGAEDAFYLKAAALRALERRTEALAASEDALARFPAGTYFDALWLMRLELVSSAGNCREVLKTLQARGDVPSGVRDRALSLGAEAAAREGDFVLALTYTRQVAKGQGPAAARARYAEGAYLSRLGKGEEAVRVWSEFLSAHPDDALAAEVLKARALEEIRLKNYRGAVRSFDELFQRFPAHKAQAPNLYWRGVAAIGVEDLPAAETFFQAALAAGPTPDFAHEIALERAFLLRKRGADDEAVRAYASLLDTKLAARLADADLAWLAEKALALKDLAVAFRSAALLERRTADPAWRQTAAFLLGEALQAESKGDAALAAYRRAYSEKAHTPYGTRAALALGEAESAAGHADEAARILSDAVTRTQDPAYAAWRLRAYVALAKNEDRRQRLQEALGYYILVSTLFDDPQAVPPAMRRAAEIMRRQGKVREAEELLADLKRRYGN